MAVSRALNLENLTDTTPCRQAHSLSTEMSRNEFGDKQRDAGGIDQHLSSGYRNAFRRYIIFCLILATPCNFLTRP